MKGLSATFLGAVAAGIDFGWPVTEASGGSSRLPLRPHAPRASAATMRQTMAVRPAISVLLAVTIALLLTVQYLIG